MKYIRKYRGWHFLLMALVLFSVSSTSLLAVLTPTAQAASDSGKWVRIDTPTKGCPDVYAAIDFTNSLGQKGRFTCHDIHDIRGGDGKIHKQMNLSGPTDVCNTDSNNTAVIRVAANPGSGLGPSEDYQNTKSAEFDGYEGTSKLNCHLLSGDKFQTDNTFASVNGGSPPPPATVGTGTWVEPLQADAAEIKANFTFDFGGGNKYTSPKDEVFDQTGLSPAGIMTLTAQEQAAPGSTCDSNTISYGSDPTSQNAVVTINLWGYEGGSDLHCYQRTGSLTLNKSLQDIGGTLDNSGGSSNGGKCPIKGDGDWLFCMIYNVASGAVDMLSGALQTMLYTPVDQIFTSQMQGSFNSFRNIGVALLVIVGLFMVLSQAAGLEIFAAYTVRKALPRLVIAMIGISLAWPILQFIVTLFNDLGVWTMQLLISAVGINGGAPLDSYRVGSVLFIGVGGAILWSTGIVMSLLGTLLLALIVGFMVLAIRQLVILVAVLMAPLAIAASILPSTQKIWNFWRESLTTALAMFPIIMAFLGAGKAMSYVAGQVAEGTPDAGRSLTWKLLSVLCLIVPLFLLPFAFRIAGGIVGTAHALVTGSSLGKGLFGRLSEARNKKLAERGHDFTSGNYFKQGGMISRIPKIGGKIDNAAKAASTGLAGAYWFSTNPLNAGRRRSRRGSEEMAHIAKAFEDPEVGYITGNEDYWEAGRAGAKEGDSHVYTGSEADARFYLSTRKGYKGKDLDRAVGAVMNVKRKYGEQMFQAMAAIGTAGTGTGFVKTRVGANGQLEFVKDENGNNIGDPNAMYEAIMHASHGDKGLAANLLNAARGKAQGAGRLDLAGAGFGATINQIYNVMDGKQAKVDTQALLLDAFKSNDSVSLSRARANGLSAITQAVADKIQELDVNKAAWAANPPRTLEEQQKQRNEELQLGGLVAQLENLRRTSLMYAPAQRVEIIAKATGDTYGARGQVAYDVQNTPTTYDPVTRKANPAPPGLGQVETYRVHHASSYQDPNDPNMQQTP